MSIVDHGIRGLFLDREVVWLHPARRCRCALRLPSGELDLPGAQYRIAARVGKTRLSRNPAESFSKVFVSGSRIGVPR